VHHILRRDNTGGDTKSLGGWRGAQPAQSVEPDWLEATERIAALCDALRGIPARLEPCSRAKVQAVREQIYYGWEKPQAGVLIAGKYERDRWWSEAAAELVLSDRFAASGWQLARDHVWPVSGVVHELLDKPRTREETAALLRERLVTCTLLTEEHARLRGEDGWARYARAGIPRRRGLPDGTTS
jgi:hypothetical protein